MRITYAIFRLVGKTMGLRKAREEGRSHSAPRHLSSASGFREVLAVAEGSKEDKASWTAFLRHLKLNGVRLFVSDKCLGLVESLSEFYPEALWQRCAVHFYRNVWAAVPASKVKEADVAALVLAGIEETLYYYAFQREAA